MTSPAATPGPASGRLDDQVERQVLATLHTLARGRANAITARQLAALVRRHLEADGVEVGISSATLTRRCRAAVSRLVVRGEHIGSSSGRPAGYFVGEALEELSAGARTLRRHLIGTARRLRAYDRATGDAVLQLLGQEILPLPKRGRAGGT